MDLVKEAYKIQGQTIIKNLEKRLIEGYYCDTGEEAAEKILSLIEDGSSVSWGGSRTLDEIGIKEKLNDRNLTVIDRDKAQNPEERIKLMKDALHCNYFLTSTNALTIDGELVNIDGNGNRVAAICFGPDNVIVVAGMNKLTANIDSAIDRVRINACVPNAIRFNLKTPCALSGECKDCLSTSICGQIVVTRVSKPQNRIKLILVGENLGF